jgi:hypothetical protein
MRPPHRLQTAVRHYVISDRLDLVDLEVNAKLGRLPLARRGD